MDYRRDEHRVHLIMLHLVWTPARRKKCLVGPIGVDCKRLIQEKCDAKGWEVAELAVLPDHVHLFCAVHVTNSAADVIKEVKGVTSHDLREKYPDLRKLPSLWTRSYFAASVGNVSKVTIQRYIANQTGF